jgi:hypothetical protein
MSDEIAELEAKLVAAKAAKAAEEAKTESSANNPIQDVLTTILDHIGLPQLKKNVVLYFAPAVAHEADTAAENTMSDVAQDFQRVEQWGEKELHLGGTTGLVQENPKPLM